MKLNMGKADRGIRIVVAIVLLVLAFSTEFAAAGILHWLFIAVAAIFAITSIVGNCPLYAIFGIRTCRV